MVMIGNSCQGLRGFALQDYEGNDNLAAMANNCPHLQELVIQRGSRYPASEVFQALPNMRTFSTQRSVKEAIIIAIAEHCPLIQELNFRTRTMNDV